MASPRSNARLVRFAIFALVLIFCGYVLTKGSTYEAPQSASAPAQTIPRNTPNQKATEEQTALKQNSAPVAPAAPFAGDSSKLKADDASNPNIANKIKATFVTLARNSDKNSILSSIRHVEDRFNKNYHYDWVFLNDEEFNEEFKSAVSAVISGKTKFGLIPKEHWSYPEWIDREKAALSREAMVQKKVIYGGSESYRHMCRFESGFFYRHELMQEYEYYWRVEPDIKIFCDIDYDIFKYMKDNDKWYGWTISLPEYKETIPTLWETTRKFMEQYPQYIAKDNNLPWISDDEGKTYNGCHFWSNFEIAKLDLWRGEAYSKYFDFLDKAGGFFYERWGDAPVHSIGASLFIPRDKLHFFGDVGYWHVPFHNCPVDQETRAAKKCICEPKDDFTWRGYSCTPKFFSQHGLKRPTGWEQFTQ